MKAYSFIAIKIMYQIKETNITIEYTKNTHTHTNQKVIQSLQNTIKMKIGLLVIYSICNRESRVFYKIK